MTYKICWRDYNERKGGWVKPVMLGGVRALSKRERTKLEGSIMGDGKWARGWYFTFVLRIVSMGVCKDSLKFQKEPESLVYGMLMRIRVSMSFNLQKS